MPQLLQLLSELLRRHGGGTGETGEGSEERHVGVSENRGTLFGGPFKGILFYWGIKGVPLFGKCPCRNNVLGCSYIARLGGGGGGMFVEVSVSVSLPFGMCFLQPLFILLPDGRAGGHAEAAVWRGVWDALCVPRH